MSKMRSLVYGAPLPQDWLDALQEYISTAVNNLILSPTGTTSVQIVAGTGNAQVSIGIGGLWRYNTATVTAAHPGGASGQWDVFVIASANSFTAGGGNETDNTDYSFGLVIVAHNTTPGGAWNGHPVTVTRKIGEVTWNGSAITSVQNLLVQPTAQQVLTGANIQDGSLTDADFAADTLTARVIAPNAIGASELANGTITDVEVASANIDGTAGTPSLRTPGVGAQQACAGNDSRLSGARPPAAHGTSHFGIGASDPVMESGLLSARPTPAATGLYYATDQDVLYMSTGVAWLRMGPGQAGDLYLTMNASALSGRVLLQGQNVSRVGIYADLFARWGTTYGVGDGSTTFGLPDARGRMPVALGTHADVATLGANDGVAVGSRRPKHKHAVAVTDPGHLHPFAAGDTTVNLPGYGAGSGLLGGFSPHNSGTASAVTGISATAGPQTGAEPTDSAAYIVTNMEAKL